MEPVIERMGGQNTSPGKDWPASSLNHAAAAGLTPSASSGPVAEPHDAHHSVQVIEHSGREPLFAFEPL